VGLVLQRMARRARRGAGGLSPGRVPAKGNGNTKALHPFKKIWRNDSIEQALKNNAYLPMLFPAGFLSLFCFHFFSFIGTWFLRCFSSPSFQVH
jgi:hypothetical protein